MTVDKTSKISIVYRSSKRWQRCETWNWQLVADCSRDLSHAQYKNFAAQALVHRGLNN